jgi:hypothetical protein
MGATAVSRRLGLSHDRDAPTLRRLGGLLVLTAFCLLCLVGERGQAQAVRGVDPTTLDGKLIFGFQGWFGCPGDADAAGDLWAHWFRASRVSQATASVELLPDVSALPASQRCPTGLKSRAGAPIALFSDQNPATVLRQFEWMRAHDLDGVALQRFVVSIGGDKRLPRSNRVLANVRRAAEATGRVFFVQYDIAGASADDWDQRILTDWLALLRDQHLGESRAYLRHPGHLALGLTGPGMKGARPADPARTLALMRALREESRPYGGVTLVGTLPRNWRTLDEDSLADKGWADVYRSYNVISPWLVGNYKTDAQISNYVKRWLEPDLAETRRLGIDYMPVVFPGFSWANLKSDPTQSNKIPRRCGRFLWAQATQFRAAGAKMLFGAMFDEVDEGTAFFPVVSRAADAPESPAYLALDADGCALPSDWYLRIATQIARSLRGEAASFPSVSR